MASHYGGKEVSDENGILKILLKSIRADDSCIIFKVVKRK